MQIIENVILDRDGTIIVDKHYLHDPAQIEFIPGATDGLARLHAAGIRLFVATNQSGIGRGYFTQADYLAVERRMNGLLASAGAPITGTAFCPHAPDTACDCRKPDIGMWKALAATHALNPQRTVMIGDKAADVRFGIDAGLAASILVLTGKGAGQLEKYGLSQPEGPWSETAPLRPGLPHYVARDLGAACDCILHYNASSGTRTT
ncbi:D-glycero-D-manno-heptose 1,7-bisphosphate phosphatase [Desulfobaculum xiamenense]|uniref:D,D-heptose 1,7-bisphosphate phosphatase n=1 Tax=Desulfobaculum xiamenense TaxID=995050 RepID=A0A846QQB6_9BACT|nr:HAD family hydrolase [Desulfobaculum xiamenense]NJB67404.1 D-glycero-D-manno-heptose 1,7-bisphosphate phosphatase [Desulfobaculum xiamenense]